MYSIGEKVKFTLYGESHGPSIGGFLEGIPDGMILDFERIRSDLALRRPSKGIGTSRKEDDEVEFLEGVRGNAVSGRIQFDIKNKNTDSSKYVAFNDTPRPGHADLPALMKFKNHEIRGGNQFSGRLTVAIVVAGSIARQFLEGYGIEISSYVRSIGNVMDPKERSFEESMLSKSHPTRSCDDVLNERMIEEILSASKDGDSVGGVVTCLVKNLPIGFGGIWFEALDSEIARGVFSIPGCKGVEFGKGFALSRVRGSESNDQFYFDNGAIKTLTNNMGGVLGGMSDGSTLSFSAAFKPTPSIEREQRTVNLREIKDDVVSVRGRHDPCIVPRAAIVVESMVALIIADQIQRGN